MTEFLAAVATYAGWVVGIAAAVVLFVKPLREWVLGIKRTNEGMKCLLRSDMLRTYYHNKDSEKIRQYEYENFILAYGAYKALKGNSFIDHIKNEVDGWEIIT